MADQGYKVAILLFTGADILDYAGPAEVLSSVRAGGDMQSTKSAFHVETIARNDLSVVKTGRGADGIDCMTIQPTGKLSPYQEQASKYDIVVVPGASPEVVLEFIKHGGPEIEFIKAFAASGPGPSLGKKGAKEKVLLSVCTGAILLGAAGILDGLEVTTHHFGFELLDQASQGKAKIQRGKRWVDAGVVKEGLRIVTSGGVSSGIDSSLHLVEMLNDAKSAESTADLLEYERRSNQ